MVLTLKSVGESVECDHSNESLRVVLCCAFVNYAVQVNSNSWVCGSVPKVKQLQMEATKKHFTVYFAVAIEMYAQCGSKFLLLWFCQSYYNIFLP